MVRPAWGLVFVTVACESRLEESRLVARVHDEAGARGVSADAGHVIPPAECTGRCCPKDCPVPTRDGASYSGPECYAQRDNTGQRRWQLRQTLSVSESPAGVRNATVGGILVLRSEFQSVGCGTPLGTSGFIQLLDYDRDTDTSRVGFARYEKDPAKALAQGLCFVEDTYDDPTYRLSQIYDPAWPKGLPKPQQLPWKIGPSVTKRVDENFVLPRDRDKILARFAADGDLKAYDGLFFMDEPHGYLHGFSPRTYVLNYDDATHYNAIPIREAELTMQTNDPEHPNCVGSFLGDNPALPASCQGNATNRAWGCYPGSCAPDAVAPASVKGYFLLEEVEQVRNGTLGQTLCHAFPASLGDWASEKGASSCREDPRWNPLDPVSGIPKGDWCAATNDVATDQCHDAFRSVSYSTFQGFPIREETCPAK